MLRYLNMFVLIGIALIGISIVGFATHNHFLAEPGQPENSSAALVYLGAGVLMLVNGVVSIRNAPPAANPPKPIENEESAESSGPSGTTVSSNQ